MSDDSDEVFEQHLRHMLAKAGDFVVPALTPERLAALRTLIPDSMSGSSAPGPFLSLLWRRVAGETKEFLSIVKTVGATVGAAHMPLVRDGGEEAHIDMITCPLSNGEMKVQLVPLGGRKARLILAVKGECAKQDDLTVELSLGNRLIEARPMEQKTEVTIDGLGLFVVTLLAGTTVVGEMQVEVGEAKDSGDE